MASPEDLDDSSQELSRLDSPALRARLAASGPCCVLASHRAGLLKHPRAELGSLAPDFTCSERNNLFTLSAVLGRALRAAGLSSRRAREALIAEVQYLALVLSGLADDFAPRVHLEWVESGQPVPGPLPWLDSAKLALLYLFAAPEDDGRVASRAALSSETGEMCVELSPGTAAVLKLPAGPQVVFHPRLTGTAGDRRRLLLWVVSERSLLPVAPEGGGWARLTPPEPVDVLLVSMPFGPVLQPSLGLSLLKSSLPPGTAKVLYLSLSFARRIGRPLYHWVSDRLPFASTLAGEWLFRSALFPEIPEDPQAYLQEILLSPTARWHADCGDDPSNTVLVPDGLVADLLQVRELTDDFLDHCVEEVLAHRPQIVGLTSVFEQNAASLALARRLKARAPAIRIVLGGSNCEGVMGLTTLRAFDCIDAVVSGEGEVALPLLVERWQAGQPVEDIQGVYTRRSPAVSARAAAPANAATPVLDDLPYAEFGDFFAQLDATGFIPGRETRLLFETSRGCWWGEKKHCTFCSLNGAGMAYRSKSGERALDELRWLVRSYPGRAINTVDNILDMQYFKTFLPYLAENRVPVDIFYEVKSNLRKEQIRLLRDAGVTAIQAGVESLSDEVLQLMGKGVKGLQNVRLLKWCEEMGVWPYWNMLWGFPGESPAEYARMAELVPWLQHLPPPTAMSPIFLERFSPNYFRSEEMGFTAVRPMPAYRHVYPVLGDECRDMAYFFEYAYQDGREVDSYVRPLMRRIADWRDAYNECTLAAVDRGDYLLLLDTRPSAVESMVMLDGLARRVYLACDEIMTVGQLRKIAGQDVATEQIESAVRPLLDRGLLLRQGDALLALAVTRTGES